MQQDPPKTTTPTEPHPNVSQTSETNDPNTEYIEEKKKEKCKRAADGGEWIPSAWKLLGQSSKAAAAVLASFSSANAEQACALGGKICQRGSKGVDFSQTDICGVFFLLQVF